MKQINFVRYRRRQLTKIEERDARNFRWALYGFAATVVVLLVVMGARFVLASQLKRTSDSITSLKQSIKNKQHIEEEYLIFMKKVQVITDLFGQRREKQQALSYFSSLFDPEIIVSQLTYDADTHTLSFTLRAPSIFSMKEVFDTMRSSNVKAMYPTFSIGQLSRAADASYSMDIVLPLPTRPIAEATQDPSLQPLPGDGTEVEPAPVSPENQEEIIP